MRGGLLSISDVVVESGDVKGWAGSAVVVDTAGVVGLVAHEPLCGVRVTVSGTPPLWVAVTLTFGAALSTGVGGVLAPLVEAGNVDLGVVRARDGSHWGGTGDKTLWSKRTRATRTGSVACRARAAASETEAQGLESELTPFVNRGGWGRQRVRSSGDDDAAKAPSAPSDGSAEKSRATTAATEQAPKGHGVAAYVGKEDDDC